jgi:hypothetical protein
VVYPAEVAGGKSCAQLVHNALLAFASRPLLGQRESTTTSAFTWLSYGQLGDFVQDAAWGLRNLIAQEKIETTNAKEIEQEGEEGFTNQRFFYFLLPFNVYIV